MLNGIQKIYRILAPSVWNSGLSCCTVCSMFLKQQIRKKWLKSGHYVIPNARNTAMSNQIRMVSSSETHSFAAQAWPCANETKQLLARSWFTFSHQRLQAELVTGCI